MESRESSAATGEFSRCVPFPERSAVLSRGARKLPAGTRKYPVATRHSWRVEARRVLVSRGIPLEPPAHPRRRVVVAEADGVRADVAVEPVAAVADVEVGAGVRGAGGDCGGGVEARGGLRRAARLRELALRQRGHIGPRPELRDVGGGDGAVAVPVGVGVVAGLAELLAERTLGEGGVGLVDLAVAVDVLGGEVARLAVGVVGDAEGQGAGAADGGDEDAEDEILAVERRSGLWKGALECLFSALRCA
jgi:hypothetical protein